MAYKKVINSRMVLASILKKVYGEFVILAEAPEMTKLFSCGQKVRHKRIRRTNGSADLAEFKPQPYPSNKRWAAQI